MRSGGYRVRPNSLRTAPTRRIFSKRPVVKNILDTEVVNLEEKIDKLFSGQDLLFERLHSEPKWSSRAYNKARTGVGQASVFVRKQSLVAKIAITIVPVLLLGGIYWRSSQENTRDSTLNEVAGVVDSPGEVGEGLNTEKVKPDFSMVIPRGKTEDLVTFAKVSPEGNAPVYAYLDMIGSVQIKVSQQEIPKQFDGDRDAKLQEVAKNFQATNVLQIDDVKVYHGRSDTLKVQSLVFIKKDRLIFIASPEELTDEVWVGYITTLE